MEIFTDQANYFVYNVENLSSDADVNDQEK